MNHLYFSDSLDILKKLHAQHPEGFIDLVYIDPPFNSKRNYNVLFETVDLHDAKAQKEAFADTWSNVSYKDTIMELSMLDLDLYNLLNALDHVRISQSEVSYLTTMAIRIYYIHKVLKPAGSFYLHCDPTMSHYLKIVCDLIFGGENYQNEIIWQRINAKGNVQQKFGAVHDVIFRYSKTKDFIWNQPFAPLGEAYVEAFYKHIEPGTNRRYRLSDLTAPMVRASKGQVYKFRDAVLPSSRCWVYAKKKMEELDAAGRLVFSKNGIPSLKRYLDENQGEKVTDTWTDIPQVIGGEFLGYPTQKPQSLLERIIKASSNEGDLVADFFCGCGTTVAAAQKLNRQWIGVDISHLAVGLIRSRLIRQYGEAITKTFDIDGLPRDIGSARQLAIQPKGRMHFQDWVIETLLGGVSNEKKVADGGYDGYTTLEVEKGKKEIVLIEVKSGNVNVKNLREFVNVVYKQKASMGVFVCFAEQITKPMRSEAKDAGYFRNDLFGNRFDKVQILSVEELMEGKQPELPRSNETGPFKKAERATEKKKAKGLFD